MYVNVSYHWHENDNPNFIIRTASHSGRQNYAVLELGDVTIFPERRHLREIHKVIGDFLAAEENEATAQYDAAISREAAESPSEEMPF